MKIEEVKLIPPDQVSLIYGALRLALKRGVTESMVEGYLLPIVHMSKAPTIVDLGTLVAFTQHLTELGEKLDRARHPSIAVDFDLAIAHANVLMEQLVLVTSLSDRKEWN